MIDSNTLVPVELMEELCTVDGGSRNITRKYAVLYVNLSTNLLDLCGDQHMQDTLQTNQT